jgi:hypothetical protein
VGSASTFNHEWHAFLFSGAGMQDLNDRLPAGSGWILQSADAINDAGQIAGTGLFHGERRAFLLTPQALPGRH